MTELLLSTLGFYFNEVTQVPAMSWLLHAQRKALSCQEAAVIKGLREWEEEFTKCLPRDSCR